MTAQTPGAKPNLIIFGANVCTMDEARPKAEAVAISGPRIVALGSTEQIRALAAKDTRLIDARGKLLLPGFNDAHLHFLAGGLSLASVDLRDATSPVEFTRRIAEYAKKLPRERWILQGNWDHEKWPGTPLPTREMIDAVTPHNPVFIDRLDGHMALANSLALKKAGVAKETKDPPGGLIVRDPQSGEPTGILKDAAMGLVERIIPAPSPEEKRAALVAATEHAARLGVTSVQDMSGFDDLDLYYDLLKQHELKTRVYAMCSIVSREKLARRAGRALASNPMVRMGGLKGFADGSLGSSTALFFEAYNDAPNTRGLLSDQMLPEGVMLKRVLAADKAAMQIMIHAIGDEANWRILNLFNEVAEKNGPRDRRFRIEHAQHLRPGEIPRFGRQKVIASMQPYHAIDDGRWCEKRIGPERSKGTYAFRALLESGAALAFGTDWPVAPLDPMQGVYAAVTRRTLDGKNPDGWIPEQKITVLEAVRAYTSGSAYAEFTDRDKGSLSPGKFADLVMLDRDIFQIPPVEIGKVTVLLTIMDGKVVFESASAGARK